MKVSFKKVLLLVFLMSVVLVINLAYGLTNSIDSSGENDNKNLETNNIYKVTFIEVGSIKCIPCKMMQPVIGEIEKEYPDVKVILYDIRTSEGHKYGSQYGVRMIPTQIFLNKDGIEYFRHEGYFPKEELEKVLQKGGAVKRES